jgi:nucleotide-binding universal stress UspA family protein
MGHEDEAVTVTRMEVPAVTMTVIGYDGSEGSQRAVDLVRGIPWDAGTAVRIVSATPDVRAMRTAWGVLVLRDDAELEDEMVAAAEPALDEPLGRLRAAGLRCDAKVLAGQPARVLASEARAMSADLLVVGSRGHGSVRSAMLGSVSMEAIDLMPCPVLVARSTAITSIVLATDGSADALAAESALARLPVARLANIKVVSIVELLGPWMTGVAPTIYMQARAAQSEDEAAARRSHEAIVHESVERLRHAGMNATGDVRSGHAAAMVLEAAEAANADLIVLGTRGRTGLTRLVLGSVSRRIAHHTHASVLVWQEAGRAGIRDS